MHSGDLNSKLVQYSNGPKQSAPRMVRYSSHALNSYWLNYGHLFGSKHTHSLDDLCKMIIIFQGVWLATWLPYTSDFTTNTLITFKLETIQ